MPSDFINSFVGLKKANKGIVSIDAANAFFNNAPLFPPGIRTNATNNETTCVYGIYSKLSNSNLQRYIWILEKIS